MSARSRFVSWLKISRTGADARRMAISSRLSVEQALERLRVALLDDRVLEVVDLVAELVEEREVAVDEVVAEGPQQVVRAAAEDRAEPVAAEVVDRPRVPVGVVDRQQEAASRGRCRSRSATIGRRSRART